MLHTPQVAGEAAKETGIMSNLFDYYYCYFRDGF